MRKTIAVDLLSCFKYFEMNMRLLFAVCLLAYAFGVHGQETDYLSEMYATHHAIAQKEGTSELLKEYLFPLSNEEEPVFAILFTPQACPRCEVDINYLLDNVPKVVPGTKIVLIAAYPDAEVARKYLSRFHTDNIIIDTEKKHNEIFHYRSGRLAVTYFLQIDMKEGRLMCGGDSPSLNIQFLHQFCSNTSYIPFAAKDSMPSLETFGETHNERVAAGTYNHVFIRLGDGDSISEEVYYLPQWHGDTFLYSDEISSIAKIYDIRNDTAYLAKEVYPTESQEKAFVSLPDSMYYEMKKNGYIYIMVNGCAFEPGTERIIVSYSLPEMYLQPNGNIAYYNHNAFLSTTKEEESCDMFSFDFEFDSIPLYMYTSASRFLPLDSRYMLIGSLRGYPITVGLEELQKNYSESVEYNMFLPEFYDYSPFCAIFDVQTGKRVKRLGKLSEVYRKAMMGYYFTDPVADVYNEVLVYTDGLSGKLWITDTKDYETGKEVDLFQVNVEESAQKDSLRYSEDYFELFYKELDHKVEAVKLDAEGIHCLVRKGSTAIKAKSDVYEYHLLSYAGELLCKYPLAFEEGDEILSVGLGLDKDRKVFPFYLCKDSRNTDGNFLKYITNVPLKHGGA